MPAESKVPSRRFQIPIAAFFILLTLSLAATSTGAVEKQSKTVIPIRSAAEIDYPPFSIVDADGRPDGFAVELLRAALAAMGRRVNFRTGPWADVRGWLENGQVQALPLVGRTPEREPVFDFTFPYMTLHGAIVVRRDTTDIRTMQDLRGRTVAVMKGDNAEEFLRREDRGITIHTPSTVEEALHELSQGRHDAVVTQRLVALRLIQQAGITNLRVIDSPVEGFRQDFCFAVREGDYDTLALLNEGLALVMADGTYRRLHAKWFAALQLPTDRRIVVGGDHKYPPYEYLDENGRPAGYNVDLTRAIALELGLDIEIRLGPWADIVQGLEEGVIDVIQGLFYSPKRELTFDFSQAHLHNHFVSVMRKGEGTPPGTVEELKNKRIVIQKGDLAHQLLIEKGLEAQLTTVGSQEEVLEELAAGKHDCALLARISALHLLEKHAWTNLAIGRVPIFSADYGYAVLNGRKALLTAFSEGLEILNKTGEYHRIYEKWMAVYQMPRPRLLTVLRAVALVAAPLVLLLLAFFLWSWSLRKQVVRKTEVLRQSEEQYRLLADNTLDVIWTMNLDLEFTYVNPACFQLTGYTPNEWIGSRLPDHCDPENLDKMSRIIARAVAEGPDGAGVIFEAELIQKDGQPVPVEIHGRITFDETGTPLMVQGVARDISERRQAEKTVQYQDRLLREMGGIAKIGAWAFDPATGEGTWTEEVARIHDLDPDAETNLELGIGFYQEASRQKIEQAVKEAIESGKPYNLELELITARGDHKRVRTIGQPQIDNGKVVQVRGSFQDITEVTQSKLRIEHLNQVLRAIREVNQLIIHERDRDTLIREGCRLLVDNRSYASALIVLTDSQDRPVSWATAGVAAASRELASILNQGRLPPCYEGARGEKAVLLVNNREGVCGKCPIAAQCAEGRSLCASLDHDGETFGFLAAATDTKRVIDGEEQSLFGEMAGDFAYALSVMNIQAAHGQLQAQLIQAQKMEAVGRLAGGVAHDYNNMLSVIMGYTEFALEGLDKQDPMHADLSEVMTAAKHSRDITGQLLAFARQQTIAPRLLDLNETVENMLKMLRRLIGEDIDLSWQPESGLWAVNMDPTQIDQILANLCVNARDAIADVGKVTIETGKTTFDKAYCANHAGFVPGDFVLLAVSDDGCGMDKATLDNLFEPFFTTKSVGKGTGLGLATVYGIVKQNEGFINVYSEPGKGTTFKIYLPRHADTAAPMKADEALEIPAGHGETVLVVEDDPAVLKLAERFLTDLGYRVLLAGTPADALQLAEAHSDAIALLITDVVMPEMNGRDLAGQLHTLYPDLKTLFMSGYTANVIAHRGVLDEGVNFIQKPFSKKDLASKVKAALDTAGEVQ